MKLFKQISENSSYFRKHISGISSIFFRIYKPITEFCLYWLACKAFTHTYRAHFSCFGWSKSCWCCSCDFAHRLQSFASNWHFLFVVVVIAFLLTHKKLIRMAGKIWWTFCYVLFRRFRRRRSGCCSICCMLFYFCLPSCCSFFSFLLIRIGKAWKKLKPSVKLHYYNWVTESSLCKMNPLLSRHFLSI